MNGHKVTEIERWATAQGRACVRFDYSGCGRSTGDFLDGSISRWTDDAQALIDHVAPDAPIILVGSSMGGWIGLRLAIANKARVRGFVGIAPAPDFVEWGVLPALGKNERAELAQFGYVKRRGPREDSPTLFSRALIEDGPACGLLNDTIAYDGPVRLLHGQNDRDVPWRISLRITQRLSSRDVRLTLIKDGEHSLSRPEDIALLLAEISEL